MFSKIIRLIWLRIFSTERWNLFNTKTPLSQYLILSVTDKCIYLVTQLPIYYTKDSTENYFILFYTKWIGTNKICRPCPSHTSLWKILIPFEKLTLFKSRPFLSFPSFFTTRFHSYPSSLLHMSAVSFKPHLPSTKTALYRFLY